MADRESLNREAAVFDAHLEEWRSGPQLGQFVLIKGDDVLGFYPSLEKAFATGTDRFGLEPFFVKQIVPKDAVNVSFFGKRILAA